MKCPYCGFECETGEMLPLEIMELNNMVIDCGNCGKEIKITKETFKEKRLELTKMRTCDKLEMEKLYGEEY